MQLAVAAVVRLAIVAFAACSGSAPPVPIANVVPLPPHRAVSHAPFAINNRLIAEDGRVVKTIDQANSYDVALPAGDDRYRIHGMVIDAATQTTRPDVQPAQIRNVDSTNEIYALERFTDSGSMKWSRPLHGVRSVRPPDLAVGRDRVVIAIDSNVVAFDDGSGGSAWTANGDDGEHLTIHDDTVYYIHCNSPTHDHWLIGRSLSNGAQRFRAALPEPCDPSMRVDDRHVTVVEDSRAASTLVFDLAGRELYRLAETTAGDNIEPWGALHVVGQVSIAVTDKHISAISDDGHTHWQLPPPDNKFVAADDFVDLDGGDLVIANYGAIDDDGVDMFRIAPQTGRVLWHVRVPGLGVGHSEYYQTVYARARGDDLFVISQGSGGWFMERLAVATGVRELRCTAMGCGRVL
ncbi:MAG TPA: PQQ-binding-like beta-propeller repeat protein [Kofleriaceae bacterium]|jgi:outer membrane protein assembly factor BamB|nr:PQQ-binding-like beta-propeller repeat protein [Kofleriaceae bacterium]